MTALGLLPATGASFAGTTANAGSELSAASFFTSYDAVAAGDAADAATGTVDLSPYRSPQPAAVAGSATWERLTAGDGFACAIDSSSVLWCWGGNDSGQLGTGDTAGRSMPAAIGGAARFDDVSGGDNHSCAIRTDGTLWCWGSNATGQLGDGTTAQRLAPTQIGVWSDWSSVSAGYTSTCGVRIGGSMWCWGDNNLGQLGDGTTMQRLVPTQVGADTWTSASAGFQHGCGIRADGTLWCWGANSSGQLGDGTTNPSSSPVQVGTASDWSQVAGGTHFTCGRRAATAWCWGRNDFGQLGDGTTTNRLVPTQLPGTTWRRIDTAMHGWSACGTRADDTAACWGRNAVGQLGDGTTTDRPSPVTVVGSGFATPVDTGSTAACAIRVDGALSCWGSGGAGELGDGATATSATPVGVTTARGWPSIAAGPNFTCAVRVDGTLWCWGDNYSYRLGDGTTALRRDAPTRIGSGTAWRSVSVGVSHGCATRTDSTLWCWGSDESASVPDGSAATPRPSAIQIGAATDWGEISVGAEVGCGLRGTDLWCWGLRAGDGSGGPQLAPVQVGTGAAWATVAAASSRHACARRTDRTLWCWGLNLDGQLGLGDTTERLVPTQVGSGSTWDRVAVGEAHTCATRTDGTLWCWGANSSGQLGLGSTGAAITAPTQIGVATTWSTLAPGSAAHTCATRTNGTLWCWGANTRGQLGLGTASTSVPTPTQVGAASDWTQGLAVATRHACGARSDGALRCWGWTRDNRTGHAITQLTPGAVAASWGAIELGQSGGCGIRDVGTLWCWGENGIGQVGAGTVGITESRPVQVGTNSTWRSVSTGSFHACAVRGNGTLWCWGHGGDGRLGLGDTANRSAPTQVGSSADWTQVSAGERFTCGVRASGTLWCWGTNADGQLGTGGGASLVPVQVTGSTWATVSAGTAFACATRADATLWCWGDGPMGQLGDGASTDRTTPTQAGVSATWAQVAAGGSHACATRVDGTLWCWGQNNWSQVGDGTSTNRPSPVQVGVATDWALPGAGSYHSCATRTTGTAWCWGGTNVHGDLGTGTTTASAVPAQVVGVADAVAVSLGFQASAFLED